MCLERLEKGRHHRVGIPYGFTIWDAIGSDDREVRLQDEYGTPEMLGRVVPERLRVLGVIRGLSVSLQHTVGKHQL